MDFHGETALVTGGASGSGAATARRLASDGASVVAAYDGRGARAVAEEAGGLAIRCDVRFRSSPEPQPQPTTIAETVEEKWN